MKKVVMAVLAVLLCACSSPKDVDKETTPQFITKQVSDEDLKSGKNWITNRVSFTKMPKKTFDKLPDDADMGLDLRAADVQKIDFNKHIAALKNIDFDTETVWGTQLPKSFNPDTILESGKNPGLGIRDLHKQGITGKGVSIGIIDQSLAIDHDEYKGKVRLYESLHGHGVYNSMHGPAVASIAIGNTTGVAPDAKLFHIECNFTDIDDEGNQEVNLTYMAEAIHRMLDINKQLSQEDKIRVISISRGFYKDDKEIAGSQEVYEAIEEAKKEGIFVITTSTSENYDLTLFGLGKKLGADPDDLTSYERADFLKDAYVSERTLFVPMDGRTTAGFASKDSYAYYAKGGLSWACPWLAGMYALCVQENPGLTPEQFIEAALTTAIDCTSEDGVTIGKVVHPKALIEEIRK